MSFELLGWPPDGPKLQLDHERFAYAGKFVMTATGKAVWRDERAATERESIRADDADAVDGTGGGEVVAAVAFNEDRTDPSRLWLRYLTVRTDRRGEGIGPRLVDRTVERARDRGYERVAIAVNNPYAYEALYRAGFAFTGRTTGIAELVLERSLDGDPRRETADPERYRTGLDRFADRELDPELRAFIERKRDRGPPDPEVT